MKLDDNKQWPKPGAYVGIAYSQYATLPAANSSMLRALAATTPAKAKHSIENRKVTKAMEEGIHLHTFMLEPERFSKECHIAEPCGALVQSGANKGKACGADTAEWMGPGIGWRCGRHRDGESLGKGITRDLYTRLQVAHAEIWRVAGDVMQAVADGEAYTELSLIWKDEETGVLCKARLDIYEESLGGMIFDLKKCRSADPETFGGDVGVMAYHLQSAWYRHGIGELTGVDPSFAFIAIELNPDEENGAQILTLDEEADRVGEMAMKSALAVYADCLKSGVWPGYSAEVKTVSLRPWVARREELLNS